MASKKMVNVPTEEQVCTWQYTLLFRRTLGRRKLTEEFKRKFLSDAVMAAQIRMDGIDLFNTFHIVHGVEDVKEKAREHGMRTRRKSPAYCWARIHVVALRELGAAPTGFEFRRSTGGLLQPMEI